ncbi:MAG: hypothetical protein QOD11_3025 [Bradyrhizobium sp.]|nr:hypothetical protein [Bradyrhizobium sp.]
MVRDARKSALLTMRESASAAGVFRGHVRRQAHVFL